MQKFCTVALVLLLSFSLPQSAKAGENPFVGEITIFAGNYAPRGWAFCDGRILSIAQYTTLYSILGTNYGGDGVSTFALPDLRGRVPISAGYAAGISGRSLGQKGGQEAVTLTINQMPNHNHTAQASSAGAKSPSPEGHVLSTGSADSNIYNAGPADKAMGDTAIKAAGGNEAHNNMPPFQVINYIIALDGIYPARN